MKASFVVLVCIFALTTACGGAGNGNAGGAGGQAAEASSSSGEGGAVGSGGNAAGGGGSGGEAAGGGGSAAYMPDPIPTISDEPPAACAKADQVADYFQFLDNLCDEKRYPSDTNRDATCPVIDESASVILADGKTVTYRPSTEPIEIDTTSLDGIIPAAMRVTVILVRRVAGVPHFRLLSNGTHDEAIQPWSTTKFLAAANAAATLRIASNYSVGLTSSVDDMALGDLITSVHNYDNSPYSSNSLARYFHDIGGRAKANDLIHSAWLGRPAIETFGGNYGEASPPLGFTFMEATGESVTITKDVATGYANNLSTHTLAEALKRLVLHREEATTRLPGIQWKDLRVLFYGAEGSTKYGPHGGMSADTAIYLQSAHDIDYLDQRSHGQWRIFSKLGLGTAGQFLDVGYACFPVLDPQDKPVAGWGREFVIAAQLESGGATWKERDRILARAYRAIVTRIIDGRL